MLVGDLLGNGFVRLRSLRATAARSRISKGPGMPSRSSTAHRTTVVSQTITATAADAANPSSRGLPVSRGAMTKMPANMTVWDR